MTIKDLSRAVRTRQWAKNALLLGGYIFAGRMMAPGAGAEAFRVLLAFGGFCALSGAAYIINDWQDIERDRLHPIKRNRPLASGRLSLRAALGLFLALMAIAAICTLAIVVSSPQSWGFGVAAAGYFALTLAYSLRLKHEVIIDVLSVAAGFVIRVVAGCLAIPVVISPWILVCTFNLALFVALCKRRAELLEVGSDVGTRRVLGGYTQPVLDTFIAVAAGLTIIAYSLYTFSPSLATGADTRSTLNAAVGHTPLMMTSIPFVVYGVFRYLLLAQSSAVGGEPERMLRDKPLLVNGILWSVWVVLVMLLGPR